MKDIVFSCHQPNFLPWIGYFHKVKNSDIFVILDEVQYPKNSVANRNRIKSVQGGEFITVPIRKKVNNSSFFSYREASFAQEKWFNKVFKSIEQNYRKTEYYNEYKEVIFDLFNIERFYEMNISFIKFILSEFEINTKVLLMSDLEGIYGKKNDLLINIGKHLNANVYLSGIGAKNYNDIEEFEKNDILVNYQKFNHPKYSQLYPPFSPNLSVLDLLFNEGKNGRSFLNSINE